MKINLLERYVNVLNDKDKQQYVAVVYPMLIQAYAKIGGFKSANSPEELIKKTGMWKLVRRDSSIVAGILYKDSYGRKAIAAFSDGTHLGKSDLFKLIQADMSLDRSWGEVSGKMEELFTKFGGQPIPNRFAAVLTGKHIDELDPDGLHYTRIINGTPVRKIIVGKPKTA